MKITISEDLKELIPKFLKNRDKDILYLKDYIFQKRYSESENIIHALKGVLGSYGFKEAYELSVQIEKALKNKQYLEVKEKIVILEKKMNNIEIEYIDEEF
jgi:HPt (histidine-containing phosphotransfer) domain-containing protein